MQSYRERPITLRGLIDHDSWILKSYEIVYGPSPFDIPVRSDRRGAGQIPRPKLNTAHRTQGQLRTGLKVNCARKIIAYCAPIAHSLLRTVA